MEAAWHAQSLTVLIVQLLHQPAPAVYLAILSAVVYASYATSPIVPSAIVSTTARTAVTILFTLMPVLPATFAILSIVPLVQPIVSVKLATKPVSFPAASVNVLPAIFSIAAAVMLPMFAGLVFRITSSTSMPPTVIKLNASYVLFRTVIPAMVPICAPSARPAMC